MAEKEREEAKNVQIEDKSASNVTKSFIQANYSKPDPPVSLISFSDLPLDFVEDEA